MIVLTRIDDRLLHGQVAFAWTRASGATRIVVADDEIIHDQLQKLTLELATPPGVKLSLLTVAQAATELEGSFAADRVLVVARTPQVVLTLLRSVKEIRSVNIGGMRHSPGKQLIAKAVAVNQDDLTAFREMANAGVRLEVSQLPSDSKVPLETLLKSASIL